MMCCASQFLCKSCSEILLYGFYRTSVRQAESAGNAEYMSVYGDHRLVIDHGSYYICCLSSYSRECLKL